MNSRQRFHETMAYGRPDRVPYFEEGIRREVLRAWRKQGLAVDANLKNMFQTDEREEILLDVDPHPFPKKWPTCQEDLEGYARRFNPQDHSRLPDHWKSRRTGWKERGHVLMLRVHEGFFLSMGIDGWGRFRELMMQIHNDPCLVAAMMKVQGECAAQLTERILEDVEVDAAIFSEPIGDNKGPLISPKTYAELVLTSYEPILEVLRRHSVKVIILRTYANCRLLIPILLEHGIDCLWACEVNTAAMDYRSLRKEFGKDLRLIGGIDLDVLRKDKESIRAEVEAKVPPLVAQGGYVPLADGRVREDIPFENYVYYRELLEKAAG